MLGTFMQNNNLQDPEDIDSLLEAAALARELIGGKQYEQINTLIVYTVENGYYEAFAWVLEILQEEFGKGEGCGLENFACELGRLIPNFNEFIQRLQVDFNVLSNDVEKQLDDHGEVESFFNIFTYETRYPNIHLVSAENFDVKDNDFIQYRLLFAGG